MAVGQAVYAVAVLMVVGWYSLAVWRMTDEYFRDEFKKHMRERDYSRTSRSHSKRPPPASKPSHARQQPNKVSVKEVSLAEKEESKNYPTCGVSTLKMSLFYEDQMTCLRHTKA